MSSQQIGVVLPDEAFEEIANGAVVTGQHIWVDGDEDKEVVVLDPVVGASSDAAANSGVPSAVTQRGARTGECYKNSIHSPMGDRIQRHEADHVP